jgi:flagellar biosynthesis GTPase FlhF
VETSQPPRKPRTVVERALLNQYNFIFLGAAGLFSAVTGSWLPAIVGAGAEVLWAVLGADSQAFRRWAAVQEAKEEKAQLEATTAHLAEMLDDDYRQRIEAVRATAEEIRSLAQDNQGFETALLESEMAKLGQLLQSFVRMAVNHQRLSRHLGHNPVSEVERDLARTQRALRQETDPRVQASLKQALALGQKRLRQHQQIEGAWKALSVQMDTLEKALDYLKSHILGIGNGAELADELDNLVTGVSTVAELEASTSDLIDEARAHAVRAAEVKNG